MSEEEQISRQDRKPQAGEHKPTLEELDEIKDAFTAKPGDPGDQPLPAQKTNTEQ